MIKAAYKVSVKDKGLTKLLGNLAESAAVRVGVLGVKADQTHKDSSESVGEIAAKHELGLGVPERSWLRGWIDENARLIDQTLNSVGKKGLGGREALHKALLQAGLVFEGGIKTRISNGISPPNSPSTIARKGSSTPLIDTGQLRSSIISEVTKWTG